MNLVLDASMTLSWLFRDEHTDAAHAIMRMVVRTGALVPSLWRLEIANVLRNAVRRGRCDEAFVEQSLKRLADLEITIDPETDRHAWGATLVLARDERLTVYDAAYLELAIREALPLATLDAELVAAAGRRSIRIHSV